MIGRSKQENMSDFGQWFEYLENYHDHGMFGVGINLALISEADS